MGSMVSSNVSRSGRSLLYAFYIVASIFFYVFWTLSIKFGGVDKYPVSSIDLSTSLISLAALVIYKRRNEGKSAGKAGSNSLGIENSGTPTTKNNGSSIDIVYIVRKRDICQRPQI